MQLIPHRSIVKSIVRSAFFGCLLSLAILFAMRSLAASGAEVNINISYGDVLSLWLLYIVLALAISLLFRKPKPEQENQDT